jgi:uncharacterized protein
VTVPDFGLPDATLATVRHILADCPALEKAVIYGSRAKGTHRHGSDIDLTLMGASLDENALSRIATRLDESSIPYTVDLSLFHQIDHTALREHILRIGRVFYQRDIDTSPQPAAPANEI